MGDFRTILVEGDFYEDQGSIKVQYRGHVVDVNALLEPLVGEDIQLAIHFVPVDNPDPAKWGGGCCYCQSEGWCPAGHHEDPYKILNVHGQGVLKHEDGNWWLQKFDGSRQDFPIRLLARHHARLAAATIFDIGKIRDSLNPEDLAKVEDLGVKATQLQDILGRLKQSIKET